MQYDLTLYRDPVALAEALLRRCDTLADFDAAMSVTREQIATAQRTIEDFDRNAVLTEAIGGRNAEMRAAQLAALRREDADTRATTAWLEDRQRRLDDLRRSFADEERRYKVERALLAALGTHV